MTILPFVLISFLFLSSSLKASPTEPLVCNENDCIITSEYLREGINGSADPCEDFYQFTCSGRGRNFLAWSPEKIEKRRSSSFGEARSQVLGRLKNLLDHEHSQDEKGDEILPKLRIVYKDCINTTFLARRGIEPVRSIVMNLGGAPLLKDTNFESNTFSLVDLLVKLRQAGLDHNILFAIKIKPDPQDSAQHIIHIERANQLSILRFLTNGGKCKVNNFFAASQLGFDTVANANDQLGDMCKFIALFKASLDEKSAGKNRKMKLSELQVLAPSINWQDLLSRLFEQEIPSNYQVFVSDPNHIVVLNHLLTSVHSDAIANYMIFKGLYEISEHLDLSRRTISQPPLRPGERANYCLNLVEDKLGYALASEYMRLIHTPEKVKGISILLESIRSELRDKIDRSYWISYSSKRAAIDKINALKFNIGFPDHLMNLTFINQVYGSLEVKRGTHLENVLNAQKLKTDFEYSFLNSNRRDIDWLYERHLTPTAHYLTTSNAVNVMAGLIQKGFFLDKLPSYINFGSLGTIVTHEIAHGLFLNGREYDKDGNQLNWWDNETKKNFNSRAECLVKKYDGLSYIDVNHKAMRVDGRKTLNENVADLIAYEAAYSSYKRMQNDIRSAEPSLPGLKFNQDQLFWLSAASIWCDYRSESEADDMVTDNYYHLPFPPRPGKAHSPNRMRVNIPLSNLAQFSEAFHCGPDDKMNSPDKCVVW